MSKLHEYKELFDGMPDDQIAEVAGVSVADVAAYRATLTPTQPGVPEAKPKRPRAEKPAAESSTAPDSAPARDEIPSVVRMCTNIKLKVRGRAVPYDLNFRDIVTESTHPGAIAALLRNPTVKDPKGNEIDAFEVYSPKG